MMVVHNSSDTFFADIIARAQDAALKFKQVHQAANALPDRITREKEMQGVDEALKQYYRAASSLHLKDITDESTSTFSSTGNVTHQQLGEEWNAFRRRKKKQTNVSSSEPKKPEGETCKWDKECLSNRCFGNMQGMKKGKCRKSIAESMGVSPDSLVSKVGKVMNKLVAKSMKKVFGWLKTLALSVIKIISVIFKKFISFLVRELKGANRLTLICPLCCAGTQHCESGCIGQRY